MNRPNEISLCDLNTSTACIIVDHPDGFLYTNQTHHYDCRQSESQGYLLPLGVMIRVCWDHAGPEFMKGQPLMPPVEAQDPVRTRHGSVDVPALCDRTPS